jgi:uncharacterized SAM-binding protein YcdF (DUF218 family)
MADVVLGRIWPRAFSPKTVAIGAASSILAAGLAVAPTVVSADMIVRRLEQRFAPTRIGTGHEFAGIIALGGNPDRVREAGRLARAYGHMQVLTSGAGSPQEVLELLGPGVEPGRVLIEDRSRNTYENALFSAALIRAQRPGRKWLLVTSGCHMPRAIGAFRKAGVDVAPWPIFDLVAPWAPIAEAAYHETIGLLAYWLMGRSSALYPAPDNAPPSRNAHLASRG